MPYESESIFDDYHRRVDDDQSGDEQEDPPTDAEMRMAKAADYEARELGVDLSFLYSHRGPRVVKNVKKRMLVDILKK